MGNRSRIAIVLLAVSALLLPASNQARSRQDTAAAAPLWHFEAGG